jgi:hypothetical protein
MRQGARRCWVTGLPREVAGGREKVMESKKDTAREAGP